MPTYEEAKREVALKRDAVSATGLPSVLSQIVIGYAYLSPKVVRAAGGHDTISCTVINYGSAWCIMYYANRGRRKQIRIHATRLYAASNSAAIAINAGRLVRVLSGVGTFSRLTRSFTEFIASIYAGPGDVTSEHLTMAEGTLTNLFAGLLAELVAAADRLKS